MFHNNTNNDSSSVLAKIKPPRLGRKVGCLSTRSPHRPNNIGLSVCKVVKVGTGFIEISGIDMVDQTPVLDIKPYIPCDSISLDHGSIRGSYLECVRSHKLTVPSWIVNDDVPMRNVTFDNAAYEAISVLIQSNELKFCESEDDAVNLIRQVLRQDIRGIHQGRLMAENNCDDMSVSNFNCRLDNMIIHFDTLDSEIVIKSISKYS